MTAEKICDRAGIDATTFESDFGNVRVVAQATLEAPIQAVVSLVAAEYALDRSEPESCAFGILAILEFMAANPAFAYVLYIGRREAVPSGVTLSSRPAHRFIVAMLERLRESSGLTGQPMTAGSGALGSPEAVLRREVLAGHAKRLPSLTADVVYAATVPFVGQVEALRLGRRAAERGAAATREALIEAMAETLAEDGYLETSVEKVVRRAGCSREDFDLHFAGKEECAVAAVEHILAAVVKIMSELYSPDRSEVESYLLGIKEILELMSREPAFAQISFIAARQMAPPALKSVLDSGSNLLAAMLDRLREYASAESQPPLAARAALGGAEAIVRREIALGTTDGLARFLPDFIYAATVPFLGQQEALRFARHGSEILQENPI